MMDKEIEIYVPFKANETIIRKCKIVSIKEYNPIIVIEQVDIDPEIQEVINNNYFDLL